jgi:hypothetical protein
VQHLYNAVRQLIETVNGQLSEQFHVEINHAHTFRGLCTRLYTKLTAHTLCIYLNRLVGRQDFLQIKALAFPNQHKAIIVAITAQCFAPTLICSEYSRKGHLSIICLKRLYKSD